MTALQLEHTVVGTVQVLPAIWSPHHSEADWAQRLPAALAFLLRHQEMEAV